MIKTFKQTTKALYSSYTILISITNSPKERV